MDETFWCTLYLKIYYENGIEKLNLKYNQYKSYCAFQNTKHK
jgi:hypothetical protein